MNCDLDDNGDDFGTAMLANSCAEYHEQYANYAQEQKMISI